MKKPNTKIISKSVQRRLSIQKAHKKEFKLKECLPPLNPVPFTSATELAEGEPFSRLNSVDDLGIIDKNFCNELIIAKSDWTKLFIKFENEGFIKKTEKKLTQKEIWDLQCADLKELQSRYESIFVKNHFKLWYRINFWFQKHIIAPINSCKQNWCKHAEHREVERH